MAREVAVAHSRSSGRRIEWSALVVVIVLVLGALAYWIVFARYQTQTPVHSDGEGYYAYLPAYLGHFDPSFKSVVQGHMLPAYPQLGALATKAFGLSLQPTGNWLDKYGVGTAMLLFPFFLAGHIVALLSGAHADGYSAPELYISGLGALACTVLGVVALRAMLRRWFSDAAVALTLLAVVFGTGVVNYFSYDAAFSHDFSFFALSVTLLAAVRWYARPSSWWRAALLGVAMGLVVAIRLTNVVLLLAVPLLGLGGMSVVRARRSLLRAHALRVLVSLLCAAAVLVPQVATWYVATGHLITRPYPGESFDFLHPHLIESLLWLQPHGLLPYAPVLALAFIGLGVSWAVRRDLAVPVTVSFLLFWYLTSAWYDWSFSSAFGDRAYLDILPLLAIPMALLVDTLRARFARGVLVALGAACVLVTCMLTIAWWQIRLAGNGTTAQGYAQVLLHPGALLKPPLR